MEKESLCPVCKGVGEGIVIRAFTTIYREPEKWICSCCNGKGNISREQALMYDLNRNEERIGV